MCLCVTLGGQRVTASVFHYSVNISQTHTSLTVSASIQTLTVKTGEMLTRDER